MRAHGQREGSSTHWGPMGGTGKGQWWVGSWGEIAWGEMPDINEGEEGSKSHCHGVHMHQCCMFFKWTLKHKCNLKKKERKYYKHLYAN